MLNETLPSRRDLWRCSSWSCVDACEPHNVGETRVPSAGRDVPPPRIAGWWQVGMKESQHEPLHHDEIDKKQPFCQPETQSNRRSRLSGKAVIAACLRFVSDAAAGALLPRLFATKERAVRCCAFPSNYASAVLSRTVLVYMLLSVEMKVPLQKSATSVRRNLVTAFVYLKCWTATTKQVHQRTRRPTAC